MDDALILALVGGTGFLGRAVVSEARGAGHVVRALVRERWPRTWDADPGVEQIRGTLDGVEAMRAALRGADAFIYLAATPGLSRNRDWDAAIRTHVLAPLSWLRAARKERVGLAVIIGTSLEYAGFGRLPDALWPQGAEAPRCREDDSVETADAYAATKAAGGLMLRAAARESGIGLWYLRLAPMYGPSDDPVRVIPALLRAARSREQFAMSRGEQVREWLHVADGARAILRAVERVPPDGVAVLNIGTGEGIGLAEAGRLVFELAGGDHSQLKMGIRAYRPREPHHLVMDCGRAAELLGWRPSIDLKSGIADLVRGIGA